MRRQAAADKSAVKPAHSKKKAPLLQVCIALERLG
jgi:hypothetical protein